MNPAVQTISQALQVDLDSIVHQIPEKDRFLDCCENFVAKNEIPIRALPFCTHLRKNGFPVVAKSICQFFINTNPGALTRTLR